MNRSNLTPTITKLPVLLDSCVLFPMYLRDLLLCTAEAELYLPYWSQEILNGATRNLVGQGRMTAELAMKLEEAIKAAFPKAMVEVVRRQSQALKKPPLTVNELLALLNREVPEFANNVLSYE